LSKTFGPYSRVKTSETRNILESELPWMGGGGGVANYDTYLAYGYPLHPYRTGRL